ncbi:MAG: M28 family peptidase [Candidatus Heimdallarchaeota archaeon]|nr:M28 family peptidase [Candidatus Heimdallarchaeota archaeon]
MMNIEQSIENHMNFLCKTLSTRRIGTAENKEAETYIKSHYENTGLDVELQKVNSVAWSVTLGQLIMDNKKFSGCANVYSPSCDISAPMIPITTLSELENADLNGKILLLFGDLTQTELIFKNKAYQPERDKKLLKLLLEKQPLGIITVYPEVGRCFPLINDDIGIPSFTVPAETGLILMENIDKEVQMKISATQRDDIAHNVIGFKNNNSNKKLVLVAHFDTKINTPGAMDNASGTTTLLILASLLSKLDLHCNIEFASVNSHEYVIDFHGSEIHAETTSKSKDNTLLVINVDGVGQKLGTNKICQANCSNDFKRELDLIVEKYPAMTWVPFWYESDHSAYLWKGFPVLAFDSFGVKSIYHHTTDDPSWISYKKIAEVASVIQEIAFLINTKNSEWIKEKKG